MGKYEALTVQLRSREEPEVTLTFDEIDMIVGGLPSSARTYREWWTNRISSQPHSGGWLNAGRLAKADLDAATAVFYLQPEEAVRRLDSRVRHPAGVKSPSGVWIVDDFRSNLIVDRYDPVFANMRANKLKHLRSENSEDAATWNAFRSLRQINPEDWLPELWRSAFPDMSSPACAFRPSGRASSGQAEGSFRSKRHGFGAKRRWGGLRRPKPSQDLTAR